MPATLPMVSLIIPTHQESPSLRGTLPALLEQTYPPERFEVLIVTDTLSEGVAEFVKSLGARFELKVLQQPGQGPGMRRNAGAANSRGEILIFIDDDILASPQLLEAHVDAHQHAPSSVVIGYFPPVVRERADFFRIELKDWWESNFQAMAEASHRFSYRDLLSGNFSIGRELFERVNGFDTRFPCRDDYELGFRLIAAGAQIAFCRTARGDHLDRTDLARLLKRKQLEGRWDCELGRLHPQLRPDLLMNYLIEFSLVASRILRFLAFRWRRGGDALAAGLRQSSVFCERFRLRGLWRRLFLGLQFYHYWRGVAESLGSLEQVRDYLDVSPLRLDEAGPDLVLDLSRGIREAEQLLDQYRPQSVSIQHDGQPVGRVLPQPGAEKLRGVHLRPILTHEFAWPFLKALAIEQASGIPLRSPGAQGNAEAVQ